MKVYDFILVLKSSGPVMVNRISKFMLLLAISVFVFSSVYPFTKTSIVPLVVSVCIIGWWLYVYRQQKKGHAVFFRIALVIAACGWYVQPQGFLLAIVYLVAALLEKQVKFPQEVAFDEEEVVFNSFPKKYFPWNAFRNIILKDGLLTIDFLNNRLIQKELDSYTSAQDEHEFNAFCQNRLRAVSEKPGS